MREERWAGLERDFRTTKILETPRKQHSNLLIFFLNGKMRIKIMVKWQVRVPDYRPCWEWGSNRKTSSAARHDRVYIRGGCGRGVGCLEVSDEGGGGLFTFRLAAAGIIPRQIISMYSLITLALLVHQCVDEKSTVGLGWGLGPPRE